MVEFSMSHTAASNRLSRRSALALVFVPVAVFFLLSLIGGLVASGAGADDEALASYPPASVPDLDDPSAWTSCGDSCVEPVFACDPGYTVPDGANVDERCVFAGKAPSAFPFDVIDCPGDDLVAIVQTVTNEPPFDRDGPALEDQICLPATPENVFRSGPPFECPDGYMLAEPFGPSEPYEYPVGGPFPGEAMLVPTPTPLPTSEPAPAPPPPAVTATPSPADDGPFELLLPYCINDAGEETPATITFVIEPTNFEPQCPDGSALWSNQDGLFCRPASGPDTEVLIAPGPPVSCGGMYGGILVTDSTFEDYEYCISETSGQYPYCPNGFALLGDRYFPDSEPASVDDLFCTDDEAVIDEYFAELEAQFEAHDASKAAEYAVHQATKDAAHNDFKAEYGLPNGDDLSAWTACGIDCYEPVFACGPGFTATEGSGADQVCERDEDALEPAPPFEVIDCPGDDVVAVVEELTEDRFTGPFDSIENQVCVPPTAENLFNSGLDCPAGYTLVDPYGPTESYEYPIFVDEPPLPPPPLPVPIPLPPVVVPTPAPGAVMESPVGIALPSIELPYCSGPDGGELPATSSYILEPTNYRPDCPEGSTLYGGSNGLFCRPADGPDAPVLVTESAPVCSENQTLVTDTIFESYQYCQTTTIEPYPYCPNGYFPDLFFGEGDSLADVTCISEGYFFEGADSIETILASDAALEDEYVSYPASPSDGDEDAASYVGPACPAFALLNDGTCANVISGSAGVAPAATALPAPTAVVHFVQQQATGAPVTVAQAPARLPTVSAAAKTTTSAKLAHTGSGSLTALYIALSLIAGGAVAMASRRQELDAQT